MTKIGFAVLGFALVIFSQTARAQQAPTAPTGAASQTPQAAATAHGDEKQTPKVWTDDNIWQVRSPEDVYVDQELAAKLDQRKPTAPAPTPPAEPWRANGVPAVVLKLPDTVEQTEQDIEQRQQLADHFGQQLQETKERHDTESDPIIRANLEQKSSLLNDELSGTRDDLQKLQAHLKELQAKRDSGSPKPE